MPSVYARYRFAAKLCAFKPLLGACIDSVTAGPHIAHPEMGTNVAIDGSAYANGQRFVSKNGPERKVSSNPDASSEHRSAVSTRNGGGYYCYKVHAAACVVTGLPLRVRGRDHVALHADLTLAKLGCVLATARAVPALPRRFGSGRAVRLAQRVPWTYGEFPSVLPQQEADDFMAAEKVVPDRGQPIIWELANAWARWRGFVEVRGVQVGEVFLVAHREVNERWSFKSTTTARRSTAWRRAHTTTGTRTLAWGALAAFQQRCAHAFMSTSTARVLTLTALKLCPANRRRSTTPMSWRSFVITPASRSDRRISIRPSWFQG